MDSRIIIVIVSLIASAAIIAYIVMDKEHMEVSIDKKTTSVEKEVSLPEGVSNTEFAKAEAKPVDSQIKPQDLLPISDEVRRFTETPADADKDGKNFLSAGYNVGVNTVSSSLKNANLQIRSDPFIPRTETGPWNQSTIMSSDLTNRKQFEIGTTV